MAPSSFEAQTSETSPLVNKSSDKDEEELNRRPIPEDVENAADKHNIFMWTEGHESIDRRMVCRIGHEASWINSVAHLPRVGFSGRELPTIMPRGGLEQRKYIRMTNVQALITYAEQATISMIEMKATRTDEKGEPYRFMNDNGDIDPAYQGFFYKLPDGHPRQGTHMGLLQTWNVNADAGWSTACSPEQGGLELTIQISDTGDVNVNAIREQVHEFERNLPDGDLEEATRRTNEILDSLKVRAPLFRNAVASFLGKPSSYAPSLEVLYCVVQTKRKEPVEPVFVGTVRAMGKFLTPAVRSFLQVKEHDKTTGKLVVTATYKNGAPAGDKTFFLPANNEYIVFYRRRGGQIFSCIKGLKQFQKEGVFMNDKRKFSCNIEYFMNHAECIKVLGAGGYAKVESFRFDGTNFAVKTCHGMREFEHEGRAFHVISKNPHPCVVHVFLWGYTGCGLNDLNAGCRLVMEQTRTNLENAIQEMHPEDHLQDGFRKAWAGQTFSGLEHLHRCKIAHRDIKPPNILISYENIAKITDCGSSRVCGARTTISLRQAIGTCGYMAPEMYEHMALANPRRIVPDLENQVLTYDEMRVQRTRAWSREALEASPDASVEAKWRRKFDSYVLEELKFHTATFSGSIQWDLDRKLGIVNKVCDDPQAQKAGVQAGWRIVRIDGVKYTDKLMQEKIKGDVPYRIVFATTKEGGLAQLLSQEQKVKESALHTHVQEHVALEERDLYSYGCVLAFIFSGEHPLGAWVRGDAGFGVDNEEFWQRLVEKQLEWQTAINQDAQKAQKGWPDLATQLIRQSPVKRWRHTQVRHAMRDWQFFQINLPDGGSHQADLGVGDEVEEQMTEDDRTAQGLIIRACGKVTSINDDETVDIAWSGLPPSRVRKDQVRKSTEADSTMLLGGPPEYGKHARDVWWWITRENDGATCEDAAVAVC